MLILENQIAENILILQYFKREKITNFFIKLNLNVVFLLMDDHIQFDVLFQLLKHALEMPKEFTKK